jgi:hypothetical protein
MRSIGTSLSSAVIGTVLALFLPRQRASSD